MSINEYGVSSNNLSNSDLYTMLRYGREYAAVYKEEALTNAVDLMVLAKAEEKFSLRFWFEEGARNVPGMWQSRLEAVLGNFERRVNDAMIQLIVSGEVVD